jgi:hypothetical protein
MTALPMNRTAGERAKELSGSMAAAALFAGFRPAVRLGQAIAPARAAALRGVIQAGKFPDLGLWSRGGGWANIAAQVPEQAPTVRVYHGVGTTRVAPELRQAESAKVVESILAHIDPRFLQDTTRFKKGFYTADESRTTAAELAHHQTPTYYVAAFWLNTRSAKVLDLTDPYTAKLWHYVPTNDYVVEHTIADRAMKRGFDVIKFSSLRGKGVNYAVKANFAHILQADLVFPGPDWRASANWSDPPR